MQTRLFFLVQSEQQALQTVHWLTQYFERDSLNVLARHDKQLLSQDLPNASISETSDIVGAVKRGAALGSAVFAGLAVTVLPPLGVLGTTGVITGGAVLGSWSSTLIGVSIPHEDVEAFSEVVDNGGVIVFVDANQKQHKAIEKNLDKAPVGIQYRTAPLSKNTA